jgi:hypothetical protein
MSSVKPIVRSSFWTKWRKLINPEREFKIARDEQAAAFVLDCLAASEEFARLSEDVMAHLCPRYEDLDVRLVGMDTEGRSVIEETFELEIWKAITDKVPEDVLRRVVEKAVTLQLKRKGISI